MLGRGKYGSVTTDPNDDRCARKQFRRMKDLVQEVMVTHYLSDCDQVVAIKAVKVKTLEMVTVKWVMNLQSYHRSRDISYKRGINIFEQLLKGLVYMQDRYIVHGDIKLNNILINNNFDVCFCDFGMSSIDCYAKSKGAAPGYCRKTTDNHYGHDMFAIAVCMSEIFCNIPLERYRQPSILREQVTRSSAHSIIKRVVNLMAPDDINKAANAKTILRLLTNTNDIPRYPLRQPIKYPTQTPTYDIEWMRDTIGTICTRYGINRSRKCCMALLNYFNSPSYKETAHKYDIYVAVALFTFSSSFGSKYTYTLDTARSLVGDRTYTKDDYFLVLTKLITDSNYIDSCLTPTDVCEW